MKYITYLLSLTLMLCSCANLLSELGDNDPYIGQTKQLTVQLVFPQGANTTQTANIQVISNKNGATYKLQSDDQNRVIINLQYGFYSVTASCENAGVYYNGTIDNVRLIESQSGDVVVQIQMQSSSTSQLIFKEIYYGGTSFEGGSPIYQHDKYVSIYNNSDQVAYLDGLCFASIEPNGALDQAYWSIMTDGQLVLRDSLPVYDAVWQFPGSGQEHTISPGEQIVIAINGAIDHTANNAGKSGCPYSVDLSKQGYWVCYSDSYNDSDRHPSPHVNLAGHWLSLLWKDGKVMSYYNYSNNSPASVIFRIPDDVNVSSYLTNPKNLEKRKGGSSSSQKFTFLMIPRQWVLDGVECMKAANFYKRLPSSIDASFTMIPNANLFYGKTVHRKVNQSATDQAAGRIIYQDTNNSSQDFEVRNTQSIK